MLASSPMTVADRARAGEAVARRRLVVAVLAAVAAVAAGTVVVTAQLALAASSPRPRGVGFPGGKYFIVTCSATHRNNDDPIALPRQAGRSHAHTFAGNRSTDASSTPESLRASDAGTSCHPAADASAYWFPTLYARGRAVMPLVAIVYYVRRTDAVEPFPDGLKMIAGNPHATRPQRSGVVSWTCSTPLPGVRTSPSMPKCSVERGLQMNVTFPDCWDGRRVDSPNHAAHMAYSSRGRCPPTHRSAVPALRLLVIYPAVRGATLSSGRYAAHADFMNGWDQDFLADRVRGLNH
jgi:hypothetical protein